LECGIRPIWVFDGKAPDLKSFELEKRNERKKVAEKVMEKAEAENNVEVSVV
jgi:flap endonuclease-1